MDMLSGQNSFLCRGLTLIFISTSLSSSLDNGWDKWFHIPRPMLKVTALVQCPGSFACPEFEFLPLFSVSEYSRRQQPQRREHERQTPSPSPSQGSGCRTEVLGDTDTFLTTDSPGRGSQLHLLISMMWMLWWPESTSSQNPENLTCCCPEPQTSSPKGVSWTVTLKKEFTGLILCTQSELENRSFSRMRNSRDFLKYSI